MPQSGGRAVFVHISDFSRRHKSPIQGLEVQYLIFNDPKGTRHKAQPIRGYKVRLENKIEAFLKTINQYCISTEPNR